MDVPFHLTGPFEKAPEIAAFPPHEFPKLQEATFTREAIRLEQDLVLAVMDHVVGQVLSLVMLAYVLVHSFLVEHGERAYATADERKEIPCGERRFRRAPG